MTTFIFIQNLLGTCFFILYLNKIRKKQLLKELTVTKMSLFYIFYLLFLSFLRPSTYVSLFLGLHIPFFFILLVEFGLKKYRISCLQRQICGFLSLILLKMHVGHSFRDALRLANYENDPFTQGKWQKLIEYVVFSQQNVPQPHKFLNDLALELRNIDEQGHSTLKSVQNLRKKYEILDEFRHRSKQALYQTRTQSLVVTGLYFASIYFVIHRHGTSSIINMLMISLSLFFLGLVGTLLLGRGIKWKH